jgi:hypothetical protein
MKRPKWQTEKKWALKRAATKRQTLPQEVERLFSGDWASCISYSTMTNKRLPDHLDESLCNAMTRSTLRRQQCSKMLEYAKTFGRLSPRMEGVFVDMVCEEMGGAYSWTGDAALKYCAYCPEVPEKLIAAIWSDVYSAINYAVLYGRRIPPDKEAEAVKAMDEKDFVSYCQNCFKGRAPEEVDEVIVGETDILLKYATDVLHGRLPGPLHSAMVMKSFEDPDDQNLRQYVGFLNLCEKKAMRVLEEEDGDMTVRQLLEKLRGMV